MHENVSKKILNSISFGFVLGVDYFNRAEEGKVVRSIEKMKALNEILAVIIPAYDSINF